MPMEITHQMRNGSFRKQLTAPTPRKCCADEWLLGTETSPSPKSTLHGLPNRLTKQARSPGQQPHVGSKLPLQESYKGRAEEPLPAPGAGSCCFLLGKELNTAP